MNEKELRKKIELHHLWIYDNTDDPWPVFDLESDHDSMEGIRLNLCGENMSNMDLQGVKIYGALLCGANFQGANLSEASIGSVGIYSACEGANFE